MCNPNMESKLQQLMELKRLQEELEAEIESVTDEIKAAMGSEEVLTAGAFKVTWKVVTSSRFDTAAFKRDHAEIAAQYTKTASVRRFTVQ